MKPFTWTFISSLALSAAAGPVPDSMLMYLNRRATVSTEEFSQLDFYAEYAGSAYCNSDVAVGSAVKCSGGVCPLVEKNGATVSATFSGKTTDIQGYVGVDPTAQLIVVSFRGSHSVRNWITNLVFLQEPCDLVDGCLVHTGFNTAYQEIAGDLIAAVTAARAAHPDHKIVFTGHSLGAALATLAAAYVRAEGFAIDIFGYGSPRVGNRAFVDHVTKQAGSENRVTHSSDPVPRLPPIFSNYRHTSPEYWLDGGASTKVDYTAADIVVCEGYANLKCNAGQLGLDIDAHSYYLAPIAACSPGGLPWKRDAAADADMTDAELEATLNDYVQKDIAAVSALGNDVWA